MIYFATVDQYWDTYDLELAAKAVVLISQFPDNDEDARSLADRFCSAVLRLFLGNHIYLSTTIVSTLH